MGEVYRARDERLERDVAIKVLPAKALADKTARSRFRKEALALSKLNHPAIATIYDFDSDNDVDFLAMEFVAGETLSQKIANGGLPEKEVLAISVQIADALEEAQEHHIVHRDLKPGNIMVTPKGRVKVLDFGLALLLQRFPAWPRLKHSVKPRLPRERCRTWRQSSCVTNRSIHAATFFLSAQCSTKWPQGGALSRKRFLRVLPTRSCTTLQ